MAAADVSTAVLVPLPSGAQVAARALAVHPYWTSPAFGVYLCPPGARRRLSARWTPTWRSAFVDWPPLGGPRDPDRCLDALAEALRLARDGARVEVGCGTGLLRTGTALAAMAALDGLDAAGARRWVRDHYRGPGPVTPGQRALVARAALRSARG